MDHHGEGSSYGKAANLCQSSFSSQRVNIGHRKQGHSPCKICFSTVVILMQRGRDRKTNGLTYCHAATYGEPAPKEEQGKDGDDVGSNLEQPAENRVFKNINIARLNLTMMLKCKLPGMRLPELRVRP